MKTQTAYCAACDKDVQIVITDEPSHDGHANLHESEVVCLEIGEACTGNLCPIGAVSPNVMAARLVRNGLQTLVTPVVTARCGSCGRATEHLIASRTHATCGECGATTARAELVLVGEVS
jgi:hypothetical protein